MRLLVTKKEVCKRWRNYCRELIRNYGKRDMGTGTTELEVARDWIRYRGEEYITNKMKRTIMYQMNEKTRGIQMEW